MVIDQADSSQLEGVEDSAIEFEEGAVFPKRGRAGSVEAEAAGDFG